MLDENTLTQLYKIKDQVEHLIAVSHEISDYTIQAELAQLLLKIEGILNKEQS